MKQRTQGTLRRMFSKKIIDDDEPERVVLSCKCVKINKYGMNQTRIILVTQKNIYNLQEINGKCLVQSMTY